jgi:glycerophosphoryl diester phosphodiesterase
VPTLVETLEAFPRLRFNIDLKDGAAVEPVAQLLVEANAVQRVCLTSFSERRIAAARRLLGPEVCTGLGVTGVLRAMLTSLFPNLDATQGAKVLQVPFSWRGIPLVTPRVVDRAHRSNLALHVWTLNDRPNIEKALDLGVDGVMTDSPQLLKETLLSRGLWHAPD